MGHSKLPWKVTPMKCYDGKFNIIMPVEDGHIIICSGLTKADAEHIVKACNAYPDLVETLENVVNLSCVGMCCHALREDGHSGYAITLEALQRCCEDTLKKAGEL